MKILCITQVFFRVTFVEFFYLNFRNILIQMTLFSYFFILFEVLRVDLDDAGAGVAESHGTTLFVDRVVKPRHAG